MAQRSKAKVIAGGAIMQFGNWLISLETKLDDWAFKSLVKMVRLGSNLKNGPKPDPVPLTPEREVEAAEKWLVIKHRRLSESLENLNEAEDALKAAEEKLAASRSTPT